MTFKFYLSIWLSHHLNSISSKYNIYKYIYVFFTLKWWSNQFQRLQWNHTLVRVYTCSCMSERRARSSSTMVGAIMPISCVCEGGKAQQTVPRRLLEARTVTSFRPNYHTPPCPLCIYMSIHHYSLRMTLLLL